MLNKALYAALESIFGKVLIANENQAIQLVKRRDPVDGKIKTWKISGGEQYHVNCPMCGDQRYRLYINYAYGMDAEVGYPSSKLVKCQNESCESATDRSSDFKGNVVVYLTQQLRRYHAGCKRGVLPSITAMNRAADSAVIETPPDLPFPSIERGWGTSIGTLGEYHPARQYICGTRRFEPSILDAWGAIFCTAYPVEENGKSYHWLKDRIFIPCPGGGWQARAVDGLNAFGPKYYNKPAWQKNNVIYGMTNAQHWSFAILVEGVTDVWRISSMPGICCFGKRISETQAGMISKTWDTVAIMLDDDAFRDKDNSAMKTMASLRRYGVQTFPVSLPHGMDPADCDDVFIRERIQAGADKAHLLLRWDSQ